MPCHCEQPANEEQQSETIQNLIRQIQEINENVNVSLNKEKILQQFQELELVNQS